MIKPLVLFSFLLAAVSHGATINWELSAIKGDRDILNQGNTVFAYNLCKDVAADATINGVLFQGLIRPLSQNGQSADNDPDFSWACTSGYGFGRAGANFTPGVTAGGDMSQSYVDLLTEGFSCNSNSEHTVALTLYGLTAGQDYAVQLWFNDSRLGNKTILWVKGGDETTEVSSFTRNNTGQEGGLGNYVTGRFTADSDTITISFRGNNYLPLQAIQLRELPGSIPEPATTLLWGATTGLCILLRRRAL